jgi:membrane protease YdiL (CAAX protease family)
LTSIIIYLYKDIFLNCLKDFFKNIGYYLKSYLKYWVLALALMIFSNAIINFFDVSVTSSNQQSIIDSLINFPIYTLIETVFLAPILEELTFRLSFRKLFKNDYVFIFLSGIVFGSLHVIGEQNLLNYLYIIPYSIPGFIFAYTLVKSKNICVPISLHFIHNLFMMILEIITIFYI